MSARRKSIYATLIVPKEARIPFLPHGFYKVAIQDTTVESGALKFRGAIVDSATDEQEKGGEKDGEQA